MDFRLIADSGQQCRLCLKTPTLAIPISVDIKKMIESSTSIQVNTEEPKYNVICWQCDTDLKIINEIITKFRSCDNEFKEKIKGDISDNFEENYLNKDNIIDLTIEPTVLDYEGSFSEEKSSVKVKQDLNTTFDDVIMIKEKIDTVIVDDNENELDVSMHDKAEVIKAAKLNENKKIQPKILVETPKNKKPISMAPLQPLLQIQTGFQPNQKKANKKKPKPKKYFKCKHCRQEFITRAQLNRHEYYHTRKECPICYRDFNVNDLNEHMREHSNYYPAYRNRDRRDVERYYRRVVYGENVHPYQCNICRDKFRYETTLINHKRIKHRVYNDRPEPFVRNYPNYTNDYYY